MLLAAPNFMANGAHVVVNARKSAAATELEVHNLKLHSIAGNDRPTITQSN